MHARRVRLALRVMRAYFASLAVRALRALCEPHAEHRVRAEGALRAVRAKQAMRCM
jgi:hypothetical protein